MLFLMFIKFMMFVIFPSAESVKILIYFNLMNVSFVFRVLWGLFSISSIFCVFFEYLAFLLGNAFNVIDIKMLGCNLRKLIKITFIGLFKERLFEVINLVTFYLTISFKKFIFDIKPNKHIFQPFL